MEIVPRVIPPGRMSQLALTFPTLRSAAGVDPFDVDELDAWACGPAPCHGGLWSARFVLAVWSGQMGRVKPSRKIKNPDWEGDRRFPVDTVWKSGLFDVVLALATWDQQHRVAFLAWAREPWWP